MRTKMSSRFIAAPFGPAQYASPAEDRAGPSRPPALPAPRPAKASV